MKLSLNRTSENITSGLEIQIKNSKHLTDEELTTIITREKELDTLQNKTLARIGVVITEHYDMKEWFRKHKHEYLYFLAFIETELIGHLLMRVESSFAHRIGFSFLYIDPKYRGNGYSKMLCTTAIKYYKEKDPKTVITLNVLSDNKVAKKLYEKLGFTTYSEAMVLR